jgi:hypothetical protein
MSTTVVKTDVNLQFNKMEKIKRSEIENIAHSNVFVMVKDNNNVNWFVGYDSYVTLSTVNGQSGQNMGDANMYSLILISETNEIPYEIATELDLEAFLGIV